MVIIYRDTKENRRGWEKNAKCLSMHNKTKEQNSKSAIVGLASGAATKGFRPVIEIMFMEITAVKKVLKY